LCSAHPLKWRNDVQSYLRRFEIFRDIFGILGEVGGIAPPKNILEEWSPSSAGGLCGLPLFFALFSPSLAFGVGGNPPTQFDITNVANLNLHSIYNVDTGEDYDESIQER